MKRSDFLKKKGVKESPDAMYCLTFWRKKIPFSNMEKLIIEIETGILPQEFIYDIGKLIEKYEKIRLS